MFKISIDTSSAEALLSRLDNDLPRILESAIERATKLAQAEARSSAPIRTGKLRRNIKPVTAKLVINEVVGGLLADVPYAVYTEARYGYMDKADRLFLSRMRGIVRSEFKKRSY